ncbi:hypothetical protein D3C80_1477750 [compost metagenome]
MIHAALKHACNGVLSDCFFPKVRSVEGSFLLIVNQVKLIAQLPDIIQISVKIDLRVIFIECFDMLCHMGNFIIVIRF